MGIHRNRTARIVAVVVAGGVVGLVGTIAAADDEPAHAPARQRSADSAEVEEWAREQGLTGLSPAALAPTDEGTTTAPVVAPQQRADEGPR